MTHNRRDRHCFRQQREEFDERETVGEVIERIEKVSRVSSSACRLGTAARLRPGKSVPFHFLADLAPREPPRAHGSDQAPPLLCRVAWMPAAHRRRNSGRIADRPHTEVSFIVQKEDTRNRETFFPGFIVLRKCNRNATPFANKYSNGPAFRLPNFFPKKLVGAKIDKNRLIYRAIKEASARETQISILSGP